MSMQINFDSTNTPENPTLILAYRDGRKIGELYAQNIIAKDSLMNPAEMSFKVRKFIDNKKNILWDKITNFKLVWYKEADLWFEIYVDIDESNETIKNISCIQLGQAELSQIMLYNVEINTENDIARDDYEIPTVLYDTEHPEASLLDRIIGKAEHYSILHVDDTIRNIQRTFNFDSISICDAFKKIAEEIGCLFIFHSDSDERGKIRRAISVYDLQSNCNDCGHRGEFTSKCPKCNSSDINEGYGEDTTIFITPDELAEDIQFTSDTDSIKNCFKLEAGDDLMTATIRNCNPNGTDYIWYISDSVKADMSNELVEKLESYDDIFNYYQKEHVANVDSLLLDQYNKLIEKYQLYNEDLQMILSPIQGYPNLMNALYNTIDFELFLESSLMPNVSMSDTNAEEQVLILTTDNLSPVAVADVSKISLATANSAILSVAKIIIDSRYRVKVGTSELNGYIWTGNFIVTNYSDEEDTAISDTISIIINDDYEYFVKQKLDKAIKDESTDDLSITGLFKLDYALFCEELRKYSLNSLTSFRDACQVCIDILIEQGVADKATWSGSDPESNLYDSLYMPYYQKLKAIENELNIRQNEIDIVVGKYSSDGVLVQNGLQSCVESIRNEIQNALDFQGYIGKELWLEFCAYRREDKYSNNNYISDGLNNSELFEKALEFIEVANDEIYKSSELQHSISAGNLNNLLVIKKFKPLTKYFKTGNWLRVLVDDKVYKLRLLEYEIDFDEIDSISVDFSDVLKTANGESDQQSIMSKITSMATSYNSVQRQASQGEKSNSILNGWNENGLDLTKTKIINNYDESLLFNKNGFWCRQYDPFTETYSDEQIKIVGSTIAITDDNWETTKTAIGKFYYVDKDNKEHIAYGVNAETIVGKFIIGEQLSMSNNSGTMTFDENGLVVKNGKNTVTINPNSKEVINIINGSESVFKVNEDGELSISGNIMARSLKLDSGVRIDSGVITNLAPIATSGSYNDLINTPNFSEVALSGNYDDLINKPNLFSGNYDDLTNKPDLFSGDYNDLSNIPEIKTSIEEDGMLPVCGKAVYEFALSKKQDVSNAEKLLYIDTEGNIMPINIDDLKVLLGI